MKWISVNDRLPDNNSRVVFYGPTTGRRIGLFGNRCLAYGYDVIDTWFWKNGSTQYQRKSITHWIPLPDPPKE